MTRRPTVARRAEQLLGTSVVATAPVAGGDISTATRLRMSDGTVAFAKTLPTPPAGFYAAEARGLRWLAEAPGGAAVPEVLARDEDCLILRWVEPGRPSETTADDLGRALAATHDAGAAAYGAEADGWIGRLPLPNGAAPTWAEFYATRRVLPYLKVARDRGAVDAAQAQVVEGLVGRFPELLPEEPPSRLHGDLWSGNVVWGVDGVAHLVDPAAYGGHREADLAMLSLFGLPQLPRVLDAYAEAHPLADDWEDRVGLHQLFPLLVHAAMFGGGYGARAAQTAARYA
ncbi:fructosamine kinase family protein [Nocardioides sp. CFH 31398]|uniref:fructosamine kinase family protein n=1 Tax=Nocardioides sp. CFH 31398 TaxID=2919579 RepID=UPI001F06A328|nr:fructosamine kinase family protein [Nocardioides sp. CFH 31398]MCH1864899.1 fructosamine kinase family protein [Nocardioides sp. CFH 31398]